MSMEGKKGLGGECGGLGDECGEPGDKKNDWRDERGGLGDECGEPGDKKNDWRDERGEPGDEKNDWRDERGEPGDEKNVIKLCCKEPENEVGFHLRPKVNDGARYIKKLFKAFQASVSCFDHRFNWQEKIRNLNFVRRPENAGRGRNNGCPNGKSAALLNLMRRSGRSTGRNGKNVWRNEISKGRNGKNCLKK